MRRRSLLAAMLAAIALLAGCTTSNDTGTGDTSAGAGQAPTTTRPSAGTAASASPTAVPTPDAPAPLRWKGCGGDFQCAELAVPLDYAKPSGETIDLAVIRLPAQDQAHRIGSLVINPGGPGGSGISYAEAAPSILPEAILARFDVVGFDPRGVGQSAPVHCMTTAQFHRYLALDPTPDTAAERKADVDVEKTFAAGCARNTNHTLLAHVSTVDAARDIDQLRAALGDAKLTYLGKSYGTLLGATYADLFPTHIRAMVLDGVVDPTLSPEQFDQVQAEGFEHSLEDFLGYCTHNGGCGLGSSSQPSVLEASLDRLLAHIDAHPLPDSADPGRTAGPGETSYALGTGLYGVQTGYPALASALQLAEQGRGDGLVQLADSYAGGQIDGSYDNELEANAAVNCLDRPPYAGGATAYASARQRLAKIAPHFGPLNVLISSVCAYWPVPPTGHPHAIHAAGSPPLVLIGGTGDPATPYSWAQSLDRQLDNDVLLTYHGAGHTVYGDGTSPCIDTLVNAYLLALTVPAAGRTCS